MKIETPGPSVYARVVVMLFRLASLTLVAIIGFSTGAVLKQDKGRTPRDLPAPASRVVNGEDVTDKKEFEFVVDLSMDRNRVSSTRYCTGTLIRPNIVLTAAHCVLHNGELGETTYATVGSVVLADAEEGKAPSQSFRAVAGYVHPEYEGLGSPNDVALLLLDGVSHVPTVKLAQMSPAENTKTWIVGYGILAIGTVEASAQAVTVMPRKLQKTALRIKKRNFCDIPDSLQTPPGMLCTAGVKEGSSACRGDSGGGLFADVDGKKEQVGIVSYGDAQCMSEDSGVFTDVASVREWIDHGAERLQKLAVTPLSMEINGTTRSVLHHAVADAYHKGHPLFAKPVYSSSVKFLQIKTDRSHAKRVQVSLCTKKGKVPARLHLVEDATRNVTYSAHKGCEGGQAGVRLTFDTRDSADVIALTNATPNEHYEVLVSGVSEQ